jgi:hypothetical protein
MYLYVELWSAKPAWHELSTDERAAYMDRLGPGIAELIEKGIEVVAWGENDADTPHRAGFDFFAVWRMPDRDHARLLEDTVERAGWYDYMEQLNARGVAGSPEAVIARQVTG